MVPTSILRQNNWSRCPPCVWQVALNPHRGLFCFVLFFNWKGKARFDGGKLSSRSRRGGMLTWRPGCDWGPGALSGI